MKVLNAYKWVPFIYPEVHFTFPHPSCPSQATKVKKKKVFRDTWWLQSYPRVAWLASWAFSKKKKKETYAIRINEYWDLCSWKCRIQRVKKKLRASHSFSVTIPFIFTSKWWILGHIWIVFAAGFCFSRRLFDMQKLMIQSWCWNEFKFLHAWLRKTTLNFKSLHFTFKPGAH